jgi:glutathionylspermidine synthase
MRRIICSERDDREATAAAMGFVFYAPDGERYWDERAYYAFSLQQIERDIEASTAHINEMCLELVGRVVSDECWLRRLQIPQSHWDFIAASWTRDDPSLYGRIDLSYDGTNPAKLLEYNADTPTSLFEAAVFQWTWL